jgi:hypothetical protein
MGRACNMNGEKRDAYWKLVGKPEGKRPLGRPRSRWFYNIKMNLREIGWDGTDWIDFFRIGTKWRVPVITVVNLRVLPKRLSHINTPHFYLGMKQVRFLKRCASSKIPNDGRSPETPVSLT